MNLITTPTLHYGLSQMNAIPAGPGLPYFHNSTFRASLLPSEQFMSLLKSPSLLSPVQQVHRTCTCSCCIASIRADHCPGQDSHLTPLSSRQPRADFTTPSPLSIPIECLTLSACGRISPLKNLFVGGYGPGQKTIPRLKQFTITIWR